MAYLQSDALEAVAYDEKARTLRCRFRAGGRTMVYEGVPQEIYDELLFADSVGAFVRLRIEGKYPAHELTRSGTEADATPAARPRLLANR